MKRDNDPVVVSGLQRVRLRRDRHRGASVSEAVREESRERVVAEDGRPRAGERRACVGEQPDAKGAEERKHADVWVAFVDGGNADPALPACGEIEIGGAELPGLENQRDDRAARQGLDQGARDRAQMAGVGEDVAACERLRRRRARELDAPGDARQGDERAGFRNRLRRWTVAAIARDRMDLRAGHRRDHGGGRVDPGRSLGDDGDPAQIEIERRDPLVDAVQQQAGIRAGRRGARGRCGLRRHAHDATVGDSPSGQAAIASASAATARSCSASVICA